jgi:hypothetical protein
MSGVRAAYELAKSCALREAQSQTISSTRPVVPPFPVSPQFVRVASPPNTVPVEFDRKSLLSDETPVDLNGM